MVTHNWNAQKDTFTMIDVFTNTKSILPSSRRKWNLWETPTYRLTPFDLIKSDNGSTIATIRHGLVLVSCRQLTFNLILLIDSHGDPEMVLPPREKKLLHPLRSSSPRVSPRRLRERSKDLWEELWSLLKRWPDRNRHSSRCFIGSWPGVVAGREIARGWIVENDVPPLSRGEECGIFSK